MKLQSDASLRQDADNVALKIRSVLPREIRDYIDRLQESTVLDPYWLAGVNTGEAEEGRWYNLSEAVARSRTVIMEYYVESRDELTRRQVNPLGLVYYTDHWNLIAYDHLRDDIRNFRLDRIQKMHVLMEHFMRPDGFDLATHLEERGMGAAMNRIVVRFTRQIYPRARRAVPAKIEEERERPDGVDVTFYFENLEYVAAWLLRYGTQVRVLEPEGLQDLMRANAQAMAEQYSSVEVASK
jgi:predicted DNA-binding transcriptional regulator YafY